MCLWGGQRSCGEEDEEEAGIPACSSMSPSSFTVQNMCLIFLPQLCLCRLCMAAYLSALHAYMRETSLTWYGVPCCATATCLPARTCRQDHLRRGFLGLPQTGCLVPVPEQHALSFAEPIFYAWA